MSNFTRLKDAFFSLPQVATEASQLFFKNSRAEKPRPPMVTKTLHEMAQARCIDKNSAEGMRMGEVLATRILETPKAVVLLSNRRKNAIAAANNSFGRLKVDMRVQAHNAIREAVRERDQAEMYIQAGQAGLPKNSTTR